jgi:hypothetical protein
MHEIKNLNYIRRIFMKKINILIFWLMICVNLVLVAAYILYTREGFMKDDYLHILLASHALSIIVYVISYFKILDTVAFRYILMGFTGLIYAVLVFFTGLNIGYVAIMAIGVVYILYFDYKTIQILVYCIILPINLVCIGINLFTGKMNDGTPYYIPASTMQFISTTLFSLFLVYSIKYVTKQNDIKINQLNEANNKTNDLIKSMKNTAIIVQKNTKLGTEFVEDIDKANDISMEIFNKIFVHLLKLVEHCGRDIILLFSLIKHRVDVIG